MSHARSPCKNDVVINSKRPENGMEMELHFRATRGHSTCERADIHTTLTEQFPSHPFLLLSICFRTGFSVLWGYKLQQLPCKVCSNVQTEISAKGKNRFGTTLA
ncbi:uncharacterized protein ACIB01_014588 [Guaruba guarouba]